MIDAATRSVEVDLKGDPGYTIVVRDPEHPTGGAEGAPDPLGRVWLSIEGTGTLAIHLSDAQLRRDATLTFAYEGHDEPMLSQTLSELGLLEELTRPTPTLSPTETPSPTPTPTEEPQPAPWQPQPAPLRLRHIARAVDRARHDPAAGVQRPPADPRHGRLSQRSHGHDPHHLTHRGSA